MVYSRKPRLFNPESTEPFKISRSKIELFLRCPLCFYLDRRLGVAEPAGYPFSLNAAVDHLLKKEFDFHRAKGEAHPLMKQYGLKAVPFAHADLDRWRENFTGVQYLHPPTNLLITGAVDDVWINDDKELHVVDYKATSKDEEVSLDADWQRSYKNQMEIYQWLLRKNNFKVSPIGYFVYVNGRRDRAAFGGRLEFNIKLIPYRGETDWLEPKLAAIKKCLLPAAPPPAGPDCDFCRYRRAAGQALNPPNPPTGQVALW
ncbi:MAG: PD-(D/E)XK nuclease family protein [Patescibacteria group bacterium]